MDACGTVHIVGLRGGYAKYRGDDYMADVVGAIDAYMGKLRASQ
ncbi:hypothetical protein XFLM_00740 [Xylella fastidiosa subsp. fastidiosa GB514]|jgi:hypothetical protein|nr:hypothetical protein XFLM_00740 [Xylella fastidiosa subsp. fastidiosa GB514]KAF0570816.1 hypothetical protein P305_07950 [Xylella fastidiosa subsp. fastidiosa Mus-1]SHH08292.1 hypothetical protein SAMN05660380_02088 [Xylella fastidiosa]